MLIRRADKETEAGVPPSREMIDAMTKYNEEMARAGVFIDGVGLKASSHGARVKITGDAPLVTDGPFAETKELIAGFTMIEAPSLAAAIEWVKKWPAIDKGADIEVRPLFGPEDFERKCAFDRVGSGPALVLVDGALCHRTFGPSGALAKRLSGQFTVFTYDRRGRGDSGDTQPYSVDREVEDLAALIAAAGGSAYVLGVSSGAALALEAANRKLPIRKLAMYESPFIVDGTRTPIGEEYLPQLKQMIVEGRRDDALRYFMSAVQVPRAFILMMRLMPSWKKLTAVAPTLVYDITIVERYQRGRALPADRWSSVEAPTLVMDGGKSPAWMRNAQRAIADAVPGARTRTLPGQTHMVSPKALAPAVVEFFLAA